VNKTASGNWPSIDYGSCLDNCDLVRKINHWANVIWDQANTIPCGHFGVCGNRKDCMLFAQTGDLPILMTDNPSVSRLWSRDQHEV